jgi:hypothetical protein
MTNGMDLNGLTSMMEKTPKKKVFESTFWKKVVEVVKIGELLVKVLQLVDGEKLAMGCIYEAMD